MDDKNIVIDVSDVTVRFNRASQQVNNLKEYVIKMVKKELMFQEFLALQNVSLQVRKGEAWGIVGTNGSGKSTLLKLICGILKPYKGSVSLSGTIAPLIELGAGFDGELTARENVLLNGTLLGYSESFMKEQFEEIIDFAELWDFLDMPIKNYSSGMAARLGFAVATMVQPDILILEGLNVLQSGMDYPHDPHHVFVSDFVDFSIYVDAPEDLLQNWYINRFLKFREGAFTDPDSYFHHYAQLSEEEAINVARGLWNEINYVNLKENILPTRERASLILTKSEKHAVDQIRLRK